MGLTAPLALLGLALVGLPIAAHLLRRADVRVRTLPTIELLRRAAVESRRRVRVVEPWLLALRVVLVVLAALALAGPFAEEHLTYGDGRVASVAIVIDDSMSMQIADGALGSRFDAAVRRAIEILDVLPSGSEVVLVRGGSRPRVVASRTADLPAVRVVLEGLASPGGTVRGSDLADAVDVAARQLAGARHALRRIVVLSDFRGPADGAALEAPDGMVLDAERVGDEVARANVAVAVATLDTDVTAGYRLEIELRAFGDDAPVEVPIDVRWRDRSLGAAEIALERGVGRTVLVLENVPGSDELEGEPFATVVATTDDALSTDDRRAVLLRPATAPRVLVVDGRPSRLGRRPPGDADGPRFLRDALGLVPRSSGGPFVTRVVDAAGFLAVPPGSVDVLVLSGLDTTSEALADTIRAHVEGGAGVLVTSGPDAAPGTDVRIADLLPARSVATVDGETDGLVRATGADVIPAGATGLEHVHVTRRTRLEAADESDVLLRFADDAPALVLDRETRAAVLALPLDATTSDLPYRPGFVPLLSRVIGALGRPGAMPDEAMAPGEPPEMVLATNEGTLELALPTGGIVSRSIEHGRVALDDLEVGGVYLARLPRPDGTLAPSARSAFVLAPPVEESDLGVRELPAARAPETSTGDVRVVTQRPLGRWAFLAVGLAAAIEGLARARRSRGAAPRASAT